MAFINAKDHFKVKLYTGTGSSQSITGVGFQPDFCWVKQRSGTENHFLNNSIQGSTKVYQTDTSAAEQTSSNGMTAFGADGFTVNTDTGYNGNGSTYLSWNWKAGTTSGITQGGASITPTSYSFNAAAGFSMIKYNGTGSNATVPHGLGKPPKMIIIKSTSHAENWVIGHSNMDDNPADSWQYYMNFLSAVRDSNSNRWQNTLPTNDVFSLGTEDQVNGSKTYIAYCWSEIPGYSAFGMYKGINDAFGPMCVTGFKPAWVLVRNVSASNNWFIQDSERLGYNPQNHLSKPNSNGADDTGTHIDILSNGFKVKSSSANNNGSGNYMIYAAFAKAPAVGANNVPCTAR